MINDKDLFISIQKLLETQLFAVLATQSEEYPYCSLVGFASSSDIKEIYFATTRATHKYKNMTAHSKISLLINSQSNKADDFKEAQALTAFGTAVEVKNDQEALGLYLKKVPYLEDFVKSADCALIKVNIDRYILVSNFQNVQEYSVCSK